jgi:hypothetical protein
MLKTTKTNKSVSAYINSIEDETKRKDAKTLVKLFSEITGKKPKIWGDNNMIGFGEYVYTRKGSKTEYEWFNVGFAVRKTNLTVYATCYLEKEKELLDRLGKHKHGKGCLYIKKLEDINIDVLREFITKHKDGAWYQ